mmetsp:Transcript_8917/g.13713  ORF Transcript_8917/g.13713 Transcript_8917/m.13713 type:complete len:82 (-) Transcript_8917:224-469(-)
MVLVNNPACLQIRTLNQVKLLPRPQDQLVSLLEEKKTREVSPTTIPNLFFEFCRQVFIQHTAKPNKCKRQVGIENQREGYR